MQSDTKTKNGFENQILKAVLFDDRFVFHIVGKSSNSSSCTNFRSSVKAKAIYLICGFHVNNSF